MLERFISTYGMLFMFFIFLLTGVILMGMINQWYMIQDQAQFIARSEGIYGGYTTDTASSVKQFLQEINQPDATIEVSAPNSPVAWGTPVWATISVPFKFQLGSVATLKTSLPITGVGRSISACLPGEFSNVVYCSP